MSPGPWDWVIIAVVALLIFGGTRLASFGKNAGKAIHDFKEEISKDDAEGGKAAASDDGASADASAPAGGSATPNAADPSVTDTPAEREPQ
jgi:sec-independent protein translocase protein TatA